jgi:hypothetical protein
MLSANEAVKEVGLKHVRLGNIGVFVQSNQELETLVSRTGGAI